MTCPCPALSPHPALAPLAPCTRPSSRPEGCVPSPPSLPRPVPSHPSHVPRVTGSGTGTGEQPGSATAAIERRPPAEGRSTRRVQQPDSVRPSCPPPPEQPGMARGGTGRTGRGETGPAAAPPPREGAGFFSFAP